MRPLLRPGVIYPAQYDTLLAKKAESIRFKFSIFNPPELEVFASAKRNYRLRAEFNVWHDGDDLYYIMFNPEDKTRVRIERFPPASRLINTLMPRLINEIKNSQVLRRKLFRIDFLSTLSNEAVVSLIYHKPLKDAWLSAAQALKKKLSQEVKLDFTGRARKQKICVDRDYVIERLTNNGRELIYKQMENSFTQPNGLVNQKMLQWALDVTQNYQGDLLELYCGNGNFTMALAQNFEKILAIETSRKLVDCVRFNISANKVHNVAVVRMAIGEFNQSLKGQKQFRRLQTFNLGSYRWQTVLVDPPRCGLDDAALELVSNYRHIVYISCNHKTLRANLVKICRTYQIERFALFDQFPYTHHVELGVLLTKK